MQIKLNELIAVNDKASNRLIDVEDLTEDEIRILHDHFRKLATMSKKDLSITQSHSVEEAASRHERKHKLHKHPETTAEMKKEVKEIAGEK